MTQATQAAKAPDVATLKGRLAYETYSSLADMQVNGENVFSDEFLSTVHKALMDGDVQPENQFWIQQMLGSFKHNQLEILCRTLGIPFPEHI